VVSATLALCCESSGGSVTADGGLRDAGAIDLGVDAFEPADLGPDVGPPPDLGPLPGSCAGSCGRSAPGPCRCDDGCGATGACCDDYEEAGCATEAELRAELRDGHVSRSYTAGRDLMYGISGSVDVVDGVVECVYTGTLAAADGTRTPEGRFNTEHVWPRSDGEPSGSAGDIYNLRPTLEAANGERASFAFGETLCEGAACPYALGGSELGANDAGATVWQVRPETRGDIARSMFYFAIRYTLDIDPTEEAVLRAWHAADPPSAEELTRVDAVETAQGNRNVLVDRPELVDTIPDF
jgi:deoxyribonuclease-1